jgi:hypothetical protein
MVNHEFREPLTIDKDHPAVDIGYVIDRAAGKICLKAAEKGEFV